MSATARRKWERTGSRLTSVCFSAALALAGLSGCASAPPTSLVQSAPPVDSPALAFARPVLAANFADPFVLPLQGGFLAFATNSGGVHVQVARSEDLLHWRLQSADPSGQGPALDAMPKLPDWVRPAEVGSTDVWAPETKPPAEPTGRTASASAPR